MEEKMIYKANILVVDDDTAVCKSVATVLENEGYTVDMVFSGEEAVEKAGQKKYALAIVDLMLPGISGVEVLQAIKQNNSNITVIMITGYPSVKTAVQSIKLSAFDYIPKPFTPNELRSLVARALERRLTYEEIAAQTGINEDNLVQITIPDNLYCIPEHSWAKPQDDGRVRIGMHHVFSRAIRGIETIEFPKKNEMRYQGEVCLRILDTHKQVMRLWTPISGKVIDVNEDITGDFSKLTHDPYQEGWLLLMEPIHFEEDIKNLNVSCQEKTLP
jgi:CheY-like chemotaxis protein/glycine cleavage system H lipoate-binding protein